MDQILTLVEQILAFFREGEAAAIIKMIKESGVVEIIVNFVKGLIG